MVQFLLPQPLSQRCRRLADIDNPILPQLTKSCRECDAFLQPDAIQPRRVGYVHGRQWTDWKETVVYQTFSCSFKRRYAVTCQWHSSCSAAKILYSGHTYKYFKMHYLHYLDYHFYLSRVMFLRNFQFAIHFELPQLTQLPHRYFLTPGDKVGRKALRRFRNFSFYVSDLGN